MGQFEDYQKELNLSNNDLDLFKQFLDDPNMDTFMPSDGRKILVSKGHNNQLRVSRILAKKERDDLVQFIKKI